MDLTPPRKLDELAGHAAREIKARLDDMSGDSQTFTVEVGGETDTLIEAICPVDDIRSGGLTFAANKKYLKAVNDSKAAAVIIPFDLEAEARLPVIKTQEPRLVFSVIMELAGRKSESVPALENGIRFKDRSTVDLGRDVVIGDFCYIGANVKIGRGSRIFPHVYIDDDVILGEDCLLYPRVTIFRRTVLGRKVIVHAGAVIGDDGFSYNQVPDPAGKRLYHVKNEHAGSVSIGDFVEIGSQVCIDRGLVGETVIGSGTKIDNLVQIAHNVKTGRDCIILAQAGLAGSVRLGERVFVLGHAGLVDGVTIGDDAILIGMAGVTNDVPGGRTAWAGRPVQKAELEWKEKALARRELPRLRDFWRLLKKAGSFEELKAEFFKK